MSNVTILRKTGGRLAIRTNTAYHIEPYTTHMDHKLGIFSFFDYFAVKEQDIDYFLLLT